MSNCCHCCLGYTQFFSGITPGFVSGITPEGPGMLRGPYLVPGMELGSAVYQVSTLHCTISLAPTIFFFNFSLDSMVIVVSGYKKVLDAAFLVTHNQLLC